MPNHIVQRQNNCLHFKPGQEKLLKSLTAPNDPFIFTKYKKTSRFNKDSLGVRFLGYSAGKPPAATMVKKTMAVVQTPSGKMRQAGDHANYWWVTEKGKVKPVPCPPPAKPPSGKPPSGKPPPSKPPTSKPPTSKPPTSKPTPPSPKPPFGGLSFGCPAGVTLSGSTWCSDHWYSGELYQDPWSGPWPGQAPITGRSRYDYSESEYESVTESMSSISLDEPSNRFNILDFLDVTQSTTSAASSMEVHTSGSSHGSSDVFYDALTTQRAVSNSNNQMVARNNDTRVTVHGDRTWSSQYPQRLMDGVRYSPERLRFYNSQRPGLW